jgi:co-chaperonin GroES (HSP10)
MRLSAGKDRVIALPTGDKHESTDGREPARRTATITAVGPGVSCYRKGDIVVYGRYSGCEMGEFVILRDDEILARVELDG